MSLFAPRQSVAAITIYRRRHANGQITYSMYYYPPDLRAGGLSSGLDSVEQAIGAAMDVAASRGWGYVDPNLALYRGKIEPDDPPFGAEFGAAPPRAGLCRFGGRELAS